MSVLNDECQLPTALQPCTAVLMWFCARLASPERVVRFLPPRGKYTRYMYNDDPLRQVSKATL